VAAIAPPLLSKAVLSKVVPSVTRLHTIAIAASPRGHARGVH